MQSRTYQWRLISAGFICLFIGAFYDIIRGPLLPTISQNLGLGFSDSGWFLGLGNFAAGIATIFLIGLSNNLPLERVVMILVAIGALTCAIAPAVNSFAMLIILGIFSGSLIAMLGSLANILILGGTPAAAHGRMLSALHTVYGVGAAFASWSVGYSIGHGIHWWVLFSGCLPLFLVLYPLAAKRKALKEDDKNSRFQSPRLFPFQYLAMTVFCLYVAGEVTTSMWMTSWLMNTKQLSLATATTILSSYFGVLLGARFLCAIYMTERLEKVVLLLCIALPTLVLFLVLSNAIDPWFLLAIGLYGPFFPVFLARVSRSSPSNWRSVTIWTIVAMNLLLAVGHLFLGKLADSFGIASAYFLPVAALGLAFLTLCIYFLREQRYQIQQ